MTDFLNFLNTLVLNLDDTSQGTGMSVLKQYAETHNFDLNEIEIVQSVQHASDFFNIDMPTSIQYGEMTGVCTHLASVMDDDILYIDPAQMTEMQITDQQAFDLVMTHEGAHRALQGIETNFTDHQEELFCDMMAGIRAALNPNDISANAIECMKRSLADTLESDTHPAGDKREDIIEKGKDYGAEYYAKYGCAPSLYDCIDHFNKLQGLSDSNEIHGLVTLRPEDAPEAVKAYSAEEIEARKIQAEQAMNYWKDQWESHVNLSKESDFGQIEASHANTFRHNYEEAKQAFLHWSHEKPDPVPSYSDTDVAWLEQKVRNSNEYEQDYWLEKLNWAKAHSLDVPQSDLEGLDAGVSDVEDPSQEDNTEIKGYAKKICPTRHGCSGASSCNSSYGNYPW